MSLDALLSHERMFDRSSNRGEPSLWSASSSKGMVAAAHYLATKAGAETLARGGNAIDAAVAASLSLGVCESAGSGLGGMAMMLVHHAASQRTFLIEGACRAPGRAHPSEVAGADRYRGYQAVAVPTQLAVLEHALSRYGTAMPADVLSPAIAIAEEGFPLTLLQRQIFLQYSKPLKNSTAAPFFLTEDGNPPAAGTLFRQPVLAKTLRRIAGEGMRDFYEGAIAREICDDMRDQGGFIEEEDLAGELTREVEPIAIPFRQGSVKTIGPPGGGLAILQMLQILSEMPGPVDPDEPEGAVVTAAIIRQARRDRRKYRLKTKADSLGEAAELMTRAHAERACERILDELAQAKSKNAKTRPSGSAGGETSHVSVMDSEGNAVALTQSIERSFGAAVVTPSLGFVYNGYLRAFKVVNQQHPHYLIPGAPARSNAAPTIAFHGEKPWAVLGSTGSERSGSSILQVLMRLGWQRPFEAVHAPRLHATPESAALLEQARFPPGCAEALVRYGFTLEPLEPYSFRMGGLQLVFRNNEGFVGVGEPRRDAAAAGPDS